VRRRRQTDQQAHGLSLLVLPLLPTIWPVWTTEIGMTLQPLTPRQREVLDFIQTTIHQTGVSPSLPEIGKRFGVTSLSTAWKYVKVLIDKGYVRRRFGHERSIELLTSGRHCPTCTCPAEHGEARSS
jgi:DNA-binding MarR family transcriptional regulator